MIVILTVLIICIIFLSYKIEYFQSEINSENINKDCPTIFKKKKCRCIIQPDTKESACSWIGTDKYNRKTVFGCPPKCCKESCKNNSYTRKITKLLASKKKYPGFKYVPYYLQKNYPYYSKSPWNYYNMYKKPQGSNATIQTPRKENMKREACNPIIDVGYPTDFDGIRPGISDSVHLKPKDKTKIKRNKQLLLYYTPIVKDKYILPQNKTVNKKATCGYKTLNNSVPQNNGKNCICTNTNLVNKDWCCKKCK